MNVANLDFNRRPIAPPHLLEPGSAQTARSIQTDGVQRAALTSPDVGNSSSEQNLQTFLQSQYGVTPNELAALDPRNVLLAHGMSQSEIDQISSVNVAHPEQALLSSGMSQATINSMGLDPLTNPNKVLRTSGFSQAQIDQIGSPAVSNPNQVLLDAGMSQQEIDALSPAAITNAAQTQSEKNVLLASGQYSASEINTMSPGQLHATSYNLLVTKAAATQQAISLGINPSNLSTSQLLQAAHNALVQRTANKQANSQALQTAANRLILEAEGINPNSLTPEQQAKMALKIQLSRDLGLTPSQINTVLHVMTMSPAQLDTLTAHMDPDSPMMGMAGVQPNLEGGAIHATHFDIAVGPPKPAANLSMSGFISAITYAMEKVMMIKSQVSQNDAKVDMQMLRDTITQNELKIRFNQEQNELTLVTLRAAIDAMRFVRIMMYLTMGIVTAIMLAIAIAVTIVTFGAAAAPAAAAMAMAIGGLIAAIASTLATIVMIVSNELKRTGQFAGARGQQISDALYGLMIALEVAGAIAGLITGVYAIVVVLQKLIQEAARTLAQIGLRLVMKQIGQIIAEMIGRIVGALTAIMQARSMTNATVNEATRSAQDSYAGSSEHAQVTATQTAQLNALDAQLAAGQINASTYAAQRDAINTAASVANAVNLGSATRTAIEQAQQEEETRSWIVMGVSIGLSIGAAIVGSFGKSVLQQMAEELPKQLTKTLKDGTQKIIEPLKLFQKKLSHLELLNKVIGMFMMIFNALIAGLQGYNQAKMGQIQIDFVLQSLNARQMAVLLEATTAMWNAIEEDIAELLKSTQESMGNLIKALTEAFDTTGKAMDKIMQAF